MRNTEDQLREIARRADGLRRVRRDRRLLLAQGTSVAVCLVLIVAAAVFMPRFGTDSVGGGGAYGSVILSSPALGYIVIGVLAFLLGVCATLLCLHMRRRRREGGKK